MKREGDYVKHPPPTLYSVDPFSKKDWYDIKAPSIFNQRSVGKTLVTRTQGTKVSAFFLVFTKNLNDLNLFSIASFS